MSNIAKSGLKIVKDVWDSKVKPLKFPLTFSINNMITEYSRIKTLFQTTLNKEILLKKKRLSEKYIHIHEKLYYFRNKEYPNKSNKFFVEWSCPWKKYGVENIIISSIENANNHNGKCYII